MKTHDKSNKDYANVRQTSAGKIKGVFNDQSAMKPISENKLRNDEMLYNLMYEQDGFHKNILYI